MEFFLLLLVAGSLGGFLHHQAKKQRQARAQPNGVQGMAETEGSGMVYFEPDSQEALMRMETKISVEPMEDEIRKLKAKGASIPRNRSTVKLSNHLYPL